MRYWSAGGSWFFRSPYCKVPLLMLLGATFLWFDWASLVLAWLRGPIIS